MSKSKQATQAGHGLRAAKAAAKAPSNPIQALAATLAAPAAAPAAKPVTVALRGGLAVAAVRLGGKAYRVACPHNAGWWQVVGATLATGQGTASVQALTGAGVPAPFVGYCVRKGYLAAAPAA
jgi:hypothetical protein